MRGIILAGGSGTRLYPITKGISKQLMPIYDKPMIYYPLSVLMLAGIKEVLIITTPEDNDQFKRLLGDGTEIGCKFSYAVQAVPNGLAQAFVIGADFIGKDKVSLVLGDNIFYGAGFSKLVQSFNDVDGAAVFAYEVNDPERYGVVEFDENNNALSLEEKPKAPKSTLAITGLYFFDSKVVDMARNIKPSGRGELEITSLMQNYIDKDDLEFVRLPSGVAWLDTGTPKSLNDAAQFVRVLEERTGRKIACLEEIALAKGWLSREDLSTIILKYGNCDYGLYLKTI
jgi:glucose-1-phosphate thymidylyltransferase